MVPTPNAPSEEVAPPSSASAVEVVSSGELLLPVAAAPLPASFDYMSFRYYTHFVVRDCKKIPQNDVRLLQHSNGLVILTVDPAHPAVTSGTVAMDGIEFGSSRNQNGTASSTAINVVGKRKKNALVCHAEMRICTIFLKDGRSFPIPACVNGFVLELNAALLEVPQLLSSSPMAEGYIAVINTSKKNNFEVMDKVWTATGGECGDEEAAE